jgi:hypothetical protein
MRLTGLLFAFVLGWRASGPLACGKTCGSRVKG